MCNGDMYRMKIEKIRGRLLAGVIDYETAKAETRPDVLMAKYRGMLEDSGFTVLDTVNHFFSPYGFTALILLAESHFAIHTFPEENKTYLELSSCVDAPFFEFVKRVEAEAQP